MNYKKLLPLFAIALLTSAAFTACSTDTPKTEKTDREERPTYRRLYGSHHGSRARP